MAKGLDVLTEDSYKLIRKRKHGRERGKAYENVFKEEEMKKLPANNERIGNFTIAGKMQIKITNVTHHIDKMKAS